MRRILPPSIDLIHNNVFEVEGFAIVGAKGSAVPGALEWTDVDAKLLNRETERLKLSLAARPPDLPVIGALHFPPFFPSSGPTTYQVLLEEAGARACVYGHLHGESSRAGPHGVINGVAYACVAADRVGSRPVEVLQNGRVVLVDVACSPMAELKPR